jgi:hypothetical protein
MSEPPSKREAHDQVVMVVVEGGRRFEMPLLSTRSPSNDKIALCRTSRRAGNCAATTLARSA